MTEKPIPLKEHEPAARLCDELAKKYEAQYADPNIGKIGHHWASLRAEACRECAALIRGEK